MAPRPFRGLEYTWTLVRALFSKRWRTVMQEGWRVTRALPHLLEDYPIPKMMTMLTPAGAGLPGEPPAAERDRLRAIADACVAFDLNRKYGICLRRSLVRYYLLCQAGVPVSICFGARKHAGTVLAQAKLSGHAWIVLHGIPYAEEHQHYRDFTVMYRYPEIPQPEPKPEAESEPKAEEGP